jgi:large subunit ribosomal protein L25
MERLKLRAEERADVGSRVARRMRLRGEVPAVVYGRDQESLAVAVDQRELHAVLHTESGLNALIDLEVGKSSVLTVARGLQRHPVRGDIIHLDFVKISLTETIEAEVALNVIGIPVGVREDGGILESVRTYVTVEALPDKIPSSIDVDISNLNVGDSLSLDEVPTVDGVAFIDDPETTLFTVQAPRIEEVAEVEVLLDAEGLPIEVGEEAEVEGAEGEGEAPESAADDSAEG